MELIGWLALSCPLVFISCFFVFRFTFKLIYKLHPEISSSSASEHAPLRWATFVSILFVVVGSVNYFLSRH